MELKDFIKTTLVDIVQGIHEARAAIAGSEAAKIGGEIAPYYHGGTQVVRQDAQEGGFAQTVDFDVAVTAEESIIRVLGIAAGAKGEAASKDARVSHVKFSVPIALPRGSKPHSMKASEAREQALLDRHNRGM
jgi:hypothetical protein